ncbi:hypothetical protein P3T18_006723 [Paraburkholderia sp. GAS199]|uniref:hypothetical protein n=1 Tax=Paraburkholderia sp. GAS199 TaxID=3035126 RepID=UPI003D2154E2
MKSLVLNDLSRLDELDRSATQSIRGGYGCFQREAPSCPGVATMPVLVHCGWNQPQCLPPVRQGCGPVYEPCAPQQPSHCGPVVVPL